MFPVSRPNQVVQRSEVRARALARCTGSEDLPIEEPRDQDEPTADLGDDQRDHEGTDVTARVAELVVGVTPPAVEVVAGDGGEEEECHRAGGEDVDEGAPAAQL